MPHFLRHSLLIQLLSVYLLFVIVVLIGGVGVNMVVEQRLRDDAQASDRALAQEIALETSLHLCDAEKSLIALGNLIGQTSTPAAIINLFQSYQAARSDVDHVYWLDSVGTIHVSSPSGGIGVGIAEFSPPDVVQRVLQQHRLAFDVGIADETTLQPQAGVIIAEPVYANPENPSAKACSNYTSANTSTGDLIGIVAANISLKELSVPLSKVVEAQRLQAGIS